jgi:hypothetical protein
LDNLPSPWNWLYYSVHASAYTAVLFLAGIYGERPKSGTEVILATQRALEQQALERWRMQKEAQIEDMMRRGVPLGAVAAALASPETAERTPYWRRRPLAACQPLTPQGSTSNAPVRICRCSTDYA